MSKLRQNQTHPYRVNVWLVTRESLATHSIANVPKLKKKEKKKEKKDNNEYRAPPKTAESFSPK